MDTPGTPSHLGGTKATALRDQHEPLLLRQRGRQNSTKDSSLLSALKELDAYAKPHEDFQVKTHSGGLVTLLASLVVLFLLVSEFLDWNSVELRPSMRVDHGRKEKMTIRLNLSFPHIPCFLVGLDVMDVSGDHQNDVDHTIFKQRTDRAGRPLHPVEKGSNAFFFFFFKFYGKNCINSLLIF